mmetsp:Transcript_23843/g.32552  ORF Transcript_23843/g.32552 Transcript_23843/m.32552 type:complete len:282 (+) Transcript_23843:166-1011(+)|eukprot:CAMPEP_0201478728 /NCGR_PEP_ID=MMETSP0151_2-20130828/3504_1 /ASSEMBLY_ACC=CAM_ASM_000257 /TAXON_ID=200890 /ORGANISM="Paramoeba atlantica, Strain 621/1 / CCAP 1560/9" /LENGTH=281 /DNA_ID=CAMNT_0047859903 /DNA_START=164 /DNA_END=1009 /DNA_ORIENTATION=+
MEFQEPAPKMFGSVPAPLVGGGETQKSDIVLQAFQSHVPENLAQVMKDEELRKAFKLFCSDQLAGENFAFWEETENFRKVEEESERMVAFQCIYTRFLDYASETELNISGPERTQLEEVRRTKIVPAEIFDEIQLNVWVNLSTELFPKFCSSHVLSCFLEERHDPLGTLKTRRKLEDFFGHSFEGSLKREELIRVIQTQGFQRMEQKREQERKSFRFWKKKKTDPRKVNPRKSRIRSLPDYQMQEEQHFQRNLHSENLDRSESDTSSQAPASVIAPFASFN